MNHLEPLNVESLYQNRGALEESLLATNKLLESLDQNNRFDDVGEYNYLLTGMEGLLSQFSENHHELHHEIKEIMESSRMGLLTHEKLVEMVTAEQLRSQYLSTIVGSLKDQIENLFTTILTSVENRASTDPEELMEKVSTNVNLMWKSVESMSKVISSPTKRLDQTIRKIDSEVVVHLSKSVQQNDGKKEAFADKLDKRLQKARLNEEKRRAKEAESDSESSPPTERRNDMSSRRHDDDHHPRKGTGSDFVATPRNNRHNDPHHTDTVHSARVETETKTGTISSATATKSASSNNIKKDDQPSPNKKRDKGSGHHHHHSKANDNKDQQREMLFDDNSSLGAGSLADSVDTWQGMDNIDDDSMTRGADNSGRSSSHHHKKHHKKSRKDKDTGKNSDNNNDDGTIGSARNTSRRPSFDGSIPDKSKHKRRHSRDKRPASGIDGSITEDIFANRLKEEKAKWDKDRIDWQKAYEAQQSVEIQRTIYRTVIPVLDLHKINTGEYRKTLHSLTSETDVQKLVALANQLSSQQQQQFGSSTLSLSSFRNDSNTNTNNNSNSMNNASQPTGMASTGLNSAYDSAMGSPIASRPMSTLLPTSSPNGHQKSSANLLQDAFSPSSNALPMTIVEDPSMRELSQQWNNMDLDQRGLLIALSNGILHSNNNNTINNNGSVQQMSSVIDQDRLINFLQEQLSHWSGDFPGMVDEKKPSSIQRSSSYNERQGRSKLNRQSSRTSQNHSHSRSPSSVGRHSDDDTWSLDSTGQKKRKPSPSKESKMLTSSSPKKSTNNNNKLSQYPGKKEPANMGLAVQGKKTQKPMTQFLDEQAFHIGQLVKAHLQREGIHDAAYYVVVTEFIQKALINAAKSHGDSGLKFGKTEHLTKSLEMIKISLPDKYKQDGHSKSAEIGINTDLVMLNQAGGGNNAGNNNNNTMGVKGNAMMTTTMVKTTTTMVNGAPVHQQQFVTPIPTSANGWELPIFDNQENILITRTYRPPEKKEEFLALLQQHPDPLTFLYEEFQSYLSKQEKLRLYFACLNTQQRIEETQAMQQNVHAPDRWVKTQELIQVLHRSVIVLDDETKSMSIIMLDLENIIQDAIEIVKTARKQGKMRMIDGNEQNSAYPIDGSNNKNINTAGIWFDDSVTQGNNLNNANGLPSFDDDLFDEDHAQSNKSSRPTASASGAKRPKPLARGQRYTIDDQNIRLMESHLFDIQRLLGELEARVLSANLQQLEYRAFFQTLQIAGPLELSNVLKESPDVKNAFQSSQEIQARLYEVQQRLLLSQDRCNRYALFHYIPPDFAHAVTAATPSSSYAYYHSSSTGGNGNANLDNRRKKYSFAQPTSTGAADALLSMMNISVNKNDPHTMQLMRIIEDLQEDVQALEEEKEDLELEILDMAKSKDRSPDAILFFSLMHDPSFVPNLQQFCLQMKQIRGFLDYSVHMDYVMLRKRLQVCMVLTPNIEKLVEKYGLMYKQWAHFRRNWFAERNLRGGSAESLATCPLCYHSLIEGNNVVETDAQKMKSQKKSNRKRLMANEATAQNSNGNTNQNGNGAAAMLMSKQYGQSAAAAAVRQDEGMLAATPMKLTVGGGGMVSSSTSVASNGLKKVSHSISLPAISSQR